MNTRELGLVEVLGAEAVGQPGQRRFRLFARSHASSAVMWVEKEQLQSLSLTLDKMLTQISEGQILRVEARAGGIQSTFSDMPADFPSPPTFEFRVGSLRLGYDQRRNLLLFVAVPMEIEVDSEEEAHLFLREENAVSLFLTLEQAQELTNRVTVLMGSGRPVCPLCNAPLDGGPHACIQQNGHREVIIEEEGESED